MSPLEILAVVVCLSAFAAVVALGFVWVGGRGVRRAEADDAPHELKTHNFQASLAEHLKPEGDSDMDDVLRNDYGR